jgi:nitroreductase
MEIFEAILTRRSIRKYSSDKIPEKTVEHLLRAAMYAPSAVNKQPWQFILIDEPELFSKIMEIHPYSKMLEEASHAILVCIDGNLEHAYGYGEADCGAATQNILLAAHGLGLGAVWVGLYPRKKRQEEISHLFELPQHIRPYALVALGFPAESKAMPNRFKRERIHLNKW